MIVPCAAECLKGDIGEAPWKTAALISKEATGYFPLVGWVRRGGVSLVDGANSLAENSENGRKFIWESLMKQTRHWMSRRGNRSFIWSTWESRSTHFPLSDLW